MNLLIHILKEVMYSQCEKKVGGAGVSLSDFRKEVGIPNATFYRAVKSLVDSGIIDRVGRDRYSISLDVLYSMELIYEDMRSAEIKNVPF